MEPPERDRAQLLCFALGTTVTGGRVRGYVELHRTMLSMRIGQRVVMYCMLHSYVRQSFLRRVLRTWQAIDQALQI